MWTTSWHLWNMPLSAEYVRSCALNCWIVSDQNVLGQWKGSELSGQCWSLAGWCPEYDLWVARSFVQSQVDLIKYRALSRQYDFVMQSISSLGGPGYLASVLHRTDSAYSKGQQTLWTPSQTGQHTAGLSMCKDAIRLPRWRSGWLHSTCNRTSEYVINGVNFWLGTKAVAFSLRTTNYWCNP